MAQAKIPFQPDYSLSPGALLGALLGELQISARELARRCGRSAKLITEILSGKAALEPETALQFEKVLDVDATIWLNMEADYRLHLARATEEDRLSEDINWARKFPTAELQSRGVISKPKDNADCVRKLLAFFGMANVEACEEYFASLAVTYRHSPSFDTNRCALFAWLRMGELQAEALSCEEYERATFIKALQEIRMLTTQPVNSFLPKITKLCASAGVAFVVLRPLSSIALSGVSRWLTPRKALIQQTARHLSNDHFWFTLFHEAAHILNHSRKAVFVDGRNIDSATSKEEQEANKWAAEFLIDQRALDEFVLEGSITEQSVLKFANSQHIAPGIVVGQLQKRGVIQFSQLNKLKDRFTWTSPE